MIQTKTYSVGSFDRYGDSRGYILDLVLTEEATDAAANSSTVSYRLQLRSGDSNRFDWELTSQLSLNGTQVAAKTEEKYLNYNSTWELLSGQLAVPHEEDGSAKLTFSATITPWNGGNTYTPPTLTISGTMTLTDIPGASTLAATAAYIGDGATVAVSRKSADFTHSIHYRFGSLSGYLADAAGSHSDTERKLTATTIVFPIPDSFYSQIPHSPSGVCTLTCRTYADNTQIGDAQQATFTVTADPARSGPVVSAQAEDVAPKTLALTGNSHIFVAGKSTVQCHVTPQARCGASITQVQVCGQTITNNSCTLENIQTGRITVRAVDTRGYAAEYTVPGLQLVPYVPISAHVQLSRTTPTGSDGVLVLSGKWFSGSFGGAANRLSAQYRINGGSWIRFTPEDSGGTISARIDLSGLDYRTGYTVQVQLSDDLETLTKTAQLSKGIPVFDWGENDVCFHVPVVFTNKDGTKFTLAFVNGQLKGEQI